MKPGIIFIAAVISGFSVLALIHEPMLSLSEMPVIQQMNFENCTLGGVIPEVIATGESDTTEWHGRFDLPDLPYIRETAEPGERILNFREALYGRLGPEIDSRELTERQSAVFKKLPGDWSGEAVNSSLLLDGKAGTISDMNCLEMMLWNWQDARFPMIDHPTEFGAFVLKGHGQFRIYLSSADLVGGRVNREVTERMHADITTGYRLVTHIHNHPFLFDREVGDRMWTIEETIDDIAGALAPSMSDVGFYRGFRDSHGLEEAWITNGLQSSRFAASEFDTLLAR